MFCSKQKDNRVEEYLKWVSAAFPSLSDCFKESVMMLSNAAIEYNQKRIELFCQKRKEDESQYPILHLDIDDILNGSFSGSRLEELQQMLNEVTEEEKKRERTLLSSESIAGLSRTALSFACEHFSPSAFQCLVNIFKHNHSRRKRWESTVDQLFTFWRESREQIFRLQKYLNLKEYDDFVNLLVEFLPNKESATFLEASLKNPRQKGTPLHPLLSLSCYQPSFRGSLPREEREKLASSIFYRTINMQFEAKQSDVSAELLSILQLLKTPLKACPLLQTREFYSNLSQTFSLVLEHCKNTNAIIFIIQEARSFFGKQLSEDKANEPILIRIVTISLS